MTFCRAHGAAHCLTCPAPSQPYMQGEHSVLPVASGRKMNKTEARYASMLEGLRMAGEIVDYRFEALTLKLGPDCRYTPDFLVIRKPTQRDVERVIHGLGLHTWDQGEDGFGGEYVADAEKISYLTSCGLLTYTIEFHEVKGEYAREDSLIKLRSASSLFPFFLFKLCRYQKGNWDVKDIK